MQVATVCTGVSMGIGGNVDADDKGDATLDRFDIDGLVNDRVVV